MRTLSAQSTSFCDQAPHNRLCRTPPIKRQQCFFATRGRAARQQTRTFYAVCMGSHKTSFNQWLPGHPLYGLRFILTGFSGGRHMFQISIPVIVIAYRARGGVEPPHLRSRTSPHNDYRALSILCPEAEWVWRIISAANTRRGRVDGYMPL